MIEYVHAFIPTLVGATVMYLVLKPFLFSKPADRTAEARVTVGDERSAEGAPRQEGGGFSGGGSSDGGA